MNKEEFLDRLKNPQHYIFVDAVDAVARDLEENGFTGVDIKVDTIQPDKAGVILYDLELSIEMTPLLAKQDRVSKIVRDGFEKNFVYFSQTEGFISFDIQNPTFHMSVTIFQKP